jgi:hypothetical protein
MLVQNDRRKTSLQWADVCVEKERKMNKVDKLTMCLQDIAKRYNLDFDADYNSLKDALELRYKRFNYYSRNMEVKNFYFERPAHIDIKRALDVVELQLISTFNLKEKKSSIYLPVIKDVIFNDPATIVFWEDGTKTVVKAQDEEFDPEKGLAMAISKKALGNQGNYCNEFKKWIPEEKEEWNVIRKISESMEKAMKSYYRRAATLLNKGDVNGGITISSSTGSITED